MLTCDRRAKIIQSNKTQLFKGWYMRNSCAFCFIINKGKSSKSEGKTATDWMERGSLSSTDDACESRLFSCPTMLSQQRPRAEILQSLRQCLVQDDPSPVHTNISVKSYWRTWQNVPPVSGCWRSLPPAIHYTGRIFVSSVKIVYLQKNKEN